MRSTEQSLAAVGVAPWIWHDDYQTPFGVTLAGYISSGAVLTWAVQYICDPLGEDAARDVSISQVASNTINVTDPGPKGRGGHGLSTGDYVKLFGTGNAGVDIEGSVTFTDATHYSVQSPNNQTFAGNARAITGRVFTHPTLTGQNARATSNYNSPVRASRLQITAYTSGVATLEILQGAMSS